MAEIRVGKFWSNNNKGWMWLLRITVISVSFW